MLRRNFGNLAAFHPIQVVAVDNDRALGGLGLPEEELDNGAFARAGGADDKGEFSVIDPEVDVVQRLGPVVIGERDVDQINHVPASFLAPMDFAAKEIRGPLFL